MGYLVSGKKVLLVATFQNRSLGVLVKQVQQDKPDALFMKHWY